MRFPVLRSTMVPLAVGSIAGAVVIAGLTFGHYGWQLFVAASLVGLVAGVPAGLWTVRRMRAAKPIPRPASPSMDSEAARPAPHPSAPIPARSGCQNLDRLRAPPRRKRPGPTVTAPPGSSGRKTDAKPTAAGGAPRRPKRPAIPARAHPATGPEPSEEAWSVFQEFRWCPEPESNQRHADFQRARQ